MRILIIEDEKKVANALRDGLEAEHYEVTIARLRRKIDEPYERKLLHTVRGLGYLLSGRQE